MIDLIGIIYYNKDTEDMVIMNQMSHNLLNLKCMNKLEKIKLVHQNNIIRNQ